MIVLLGPQRLRSTLAGAVTAAGVPVAARIAVVTCGWQEREQEDQELSAHLGGRTVNLELHRRGEEVFAADPELAAAYRARQDRLMQMQEMYRVRLEHAVAAAEAIAQRHADAELMSEEGRISLAGLRALDADHLARCRAVEAEFAARWLPDERDAVARHRRELDEILVGASALAIAGGHVAVVRNRLELFNLAPLLGDRPVFAWSAGAMAVTERMVLFHDSPPQGPGIPEVLHAGLGMVRGIVALPDPRRRLRLDDRQRMALLARRFAPARCVTLDQGAQLFVDGDAWSHATGCLVLDETGRAGEPCP